MGRSAVTLALLLAGCEATVGDGTVSGGEPGGQDVPIAVDPGEPAGADDPGADTSVCSTDIDCLDLLEGAGPCVAVACVDGSCERTRAASGTSCDDGDACTRDDVCEVSLVAGEARVQCVGARVVCADEDVCNGEESCDPATGCVDGTPLACNDEDACNGVETCDTETGCVDGVALECDDGNACTGVESCDPASGCAAGEALVCDNEDACDGVESCDPASGCVDGTPLQCNDTNACNGLETCEAATGCVEGTPPQCDDGDACNGRESCVPATGCVAGTAPTCDDGDACNGLETCETEPGCVDGVELVCDDGDVCDGTETCLADTGCVDGTPLDCDDTDECTADSCDEVGGCAHAPRTDCDDGNVCNGVETCNSAVGCVDGTPLSCDDFERCTFDRCDPEEGCEHGPTREPGCCIEVSDCDDDEECTTDTCDENAACSNDPRTGACSDGSRCTVGDACVEGSCVAGPELDCDDGNPCTDDSCDRFSACVNEPNTSGCDDGDPCTSSDACAEGECAGTAEDACKPLCTLAGEAGEQVECSVRLAREAQASAGAVSLSLFVRYQPEDADLKALLDTSCVGSFCREVRIPQDEQVISPSGHAVGLDPAVPSAWDGVVETTFQHITETRVLLNNTYFSRSGAIRGGNPTIVVLRFELARSVEGSPVGLDVQDARAGDGERLGTRTLGGLIVTGDSPCSGVTCFDGNPCTDDRCQAGECVFEPRAGECDDGNPCTAEDACVASECAGDPAAAAELPCTGEDLCEEIGLCDGNGACEYQEVLSVVCDDGTNPCVESHCRPQTGECISRARVGNVCDDDNACTEDTACSADGRCGGTAVLCDDGVDCTVDACDPLLGCTHTPDKSLCDDGDDCTADLCDPSAGCTFVPSDAECDDGDPCTFEDHCIEGTCQGRDNAPECACADHADCDDIHGGNLCLGDWLCLDDFCKHVPGSEVRCPPDGYQCKQDFVCDPATGTCDGVPAECDDGLACTVDSCAPSRGCIHEAIGLCPLGALCEISGAEGNTVECDVRTAREDDGVAPPSGADLRFGWDGAAVALDNVVGEFCFGSCFPFDMVDCLADDTRCSTFKLQPSGHDVMMVPRDRAEWSDWISLTFVHTASVDEPLNTSVIGAEGVPPPDATLVKLRFKLLRDVPGSDPVHIEMTRARFDRIDGPLQLRVVPIESGDAYVTGGVR